MISPHTDPEKEKLRKQSARRASRRDFTQAPPPSKDIHSAYTWLLEKLQDSKKKTITELENTIKAYILRINCDGSKKPFKVAIDMIDMIDPKERYLVHIYNRTITDTNIKSFKTSFHMESHEAKSKNDSEQNDMSILNLIIYKFVNEHSNQNEEDQEKYLGLYRSCFEIFSWHFACGFYSTNDAMFSRVIQKIKEVFKYFDMVKQASFARWYSLKSKAFVKRILFQLNQRLFIKCCKLEKSFKHYLAKYMSIDVREVDQVTLPLGTTLDFYKYFNKNDYREIEEVTNFIQELYFNTAYGANQHVTSYNVDWRNQERELELQEYFFDMRQDFFKASDVKMKGMNKSFAKKFMRDEVHQDLNACLDRFKDCYNLESDENADDLMAHATNGDKEDRGVKSYDVLKNIFHGSIKSILHNYSDSNEMKRLVNKSVANVVKALDNHKEYNIKPKKLRHLTNFKLEESESEKTDRSAQQKEAMEGGMGVPILIPNIQELESVLKQLQKITNDITSQQKHQKELFKLQIETGYVMRNISLVIIELDQLMNPKNPNPRRITKQGTSSDKELVEEMGMDIHISSSVLQQTTDEEFKSLKSLYGDLLFDSKIYLSMFSKKTVRKLLMAMPETAIEELVKSKNTVPIYSKLFNELIRVFYKWIHDESFELNQSFSEPARAPRFYRLICTLMTFMNTLIKKQIEENSSGYQKELLYFDFLFNVYSLFNVEDMLQEYASEDFQITSSKEITPDFCLQLFNKVTSHETTEFVRITTLPLEDRNMDFQGERGKYTFLVYLLYSMSLASSRFTITMTSLQLHKNIGQMKRVLCEFLNSDFLAKDETSKSMVNAQELIDNDMIVEAIQVIDDRNNKVKFEEHLRQAQDTPIDGTHIHTLFLFVTRLRANLILKHEENSLDMQVCRSFDTVGKHVSVAIGKDGHYLTPEAHADRYSGFCQFDMIQNNVFFLISALHNANLESIPHILKSVTLEVMIQTLIFSKKCQLSLELNKRMQENDKLRGENQEITPHERKLRTTLSESSMADMIALLSKAVNKISGREPGMSQLCFTELESSIKALYDKICPPTKQKKPKDKVVIKKDFISLATEELEELLQVKDISGYRKSVYRSEEALRLIKEKTILSAKYNLEKLIEGNSYYRKVLLGEVEMEVDEKELRCGLGRCFLKIFNKMLYTQKVGLKYSKIAENFYLEAKSLFRGPQYETEFSDFSCSNESDKRKNNGDYIRSRDKIHFLYSVETSYFYNDVYSRSIVLFEKLIDEIPDLKHQIYLESIKHRRFYQFMLGRLKFYRDNPEYHLQSPELGEESKVPIFKDGDDKKQHDLFPYLQNLNSLAIHLSDSLTSSIIFNKQASILYSDLFVLQSLLSNMNLGGYHEYKVLYAEDRFEDIVIDDYRESDIHSGKKKSKTTDDNANENAYEKKDKDIVIWPDLKYGDLDNENDSLIYQLILLKQPEQLERGNRNIIISICSRISHLFERLGFTDKSVLLNSLSDKAALPMYSILTMWIQYLCNILHLSAEEEGLVKPRTYRSSFISICYVYRKLVIRYMLNVLTIVREINIVELVHLRRAIVELIMKVCFLTPVMDNMLKYQCDFRKFYELTIETTRIHIYSHIENQRIIRNTLKRLCFCSRDTEPGSQWHELDILNSSHPRIKEMLRMNVEIFGGCHFVKILSNAQSKHKELDANARWDEIMDGYAKSDNRDLGFQFINSLVKLMNFIESVSPNWRLWSNKKESARYHFEVESTITGATKLNELKMVNILTKICKQIEVVDNDGNHRLISFRKYPEVYTLESLNPVEMVGDFDIENFKRDMCKVIPQLAIQTTVQYSMMKNVGFLYTFMKSDTSKQHPLILWCISLLLNLFIFIGYQNLSQQDDGHTFRNMSLKSAVEILALIVMGYSGLTIIFWIYSRYHAVRSKFPPNLTTTQKETQVFEGKDRKMAFLNKYIRYFTQNPYFKFAKNMLLSEDILVLTLYFLFASIGYFINPVAYVGSVVMFIFFNQTARNIIVALVINWLDIVLTLVLILVTIFIFSTLQYFYLFDNFSTGPFGDRAKPCSSMYSCYLNVVNYGLRMGGGMGEITAFTSEDSSMFGPDFAYIMLFFFFINIVSLNMLFGIVIDGLSSLRHAQYEKESTLNTICLVCDLDKQVFESKGVQFDIHVHLQHNLEDYVAFMIRLYVNSHRFEHDLDFLIYSKIRRLNISWLPSSKTRFIKYKKDDEDSEDDSDIKLIDHKLKTTVNTVTDMKNIVNEMKSSLGLSKKGTEKGYSVMSTHGERQFFRTKTGDSGTQLQKNLSKQTG